MIIVYDLQQYTPQFMMQQGYYGLIITRAVFADMFRVTDLTERAAKSEHCAPYWLTKEPIAYRYRSVFVV